MRNTPQTADMATLWASQMHGFVLKVSKPMSGVPMQQSECTVCASHCACCALLLHRLKPPPPPAAAAAAAATCRTAQRHCLLVKQCRRLSCSTPQQRGAPLAVAAAGGTAGNTAFVQRTSSFPVFLSHAGEQKLEIVSCIQAVLEAWGVDAFLDELSLQPGTRDNTAEIERRLKNASVVVAVLTKEFVTKKHPMWELGLALEQCQDEPKKNFVLIPVLQGLTIEELQDADKEIYQRHQWQDGKRPDGDTLKVWTAWLKQVARVVCARGDQNSGFQGAQAARVARCAADALVAMQLLPLGYADRSNRLLPMFLDRKELVGRQTELQQLTSMVLKYRLSLLWGGPGEGKTALANTAGAVMYDHGDLPSGAFYVDLASAYAPGTASDLHQALAAAIVPKLKLLLGPTSLPQLCAESWPVLERWLRSVPADRRVLLVLDNVDELIGQYSSLNTAQHHVTDAVTSIMGFSWAVHILMVSRSNMFMLPATADMRLRALDIEDAKQLLHNTCRQIRGTVAQDLAECCDCNAMLLQFVGLVIKKQDYRPITDIVKILQTARVRVAAIRQGGPTDTTPDPAEKLLSWWDKLLGLIFTDPNYLAAAAGLAVVRSSYSQATAQQLTRNGPMREGLTPPIFYSLRDVCILQEDLATLLDCGASTDRKYNMQRMHREVAALKLCDNPNYQQSIKEKARTLRLKAFSITDDDSEFSTVEYMNKVIAKIGQALRAAVPKTHPAHKTLTEFIRFSHQMQDGHHIWAALCLAACQLVGGKEEQALPAACALQVIQAAFHVDPRCIITSNTQHNESYGPLADLIWIRQSAETRYGKQSCIEAADRLLEFALEHVQHIDDPDYDYQDSDDQGYEPATFQPIWCARITAELRELVTLSSSKKLSDELLAALGGTTRSEANAGHYDKIIHQRRTLAMFRAAILCGGFAGGADNLKTMQLLQYVETFSRATQLHWKVRELHLQRWKARELHEELGLLELEQELQRERDENVEEARQLVFAFYYLDAARLFGLTMYFQTGVHTIYD